VGETQLGDIRLLRCSHVRLLRSGAPTFEAALADATKPRTLQELFNRFQAWLNAR